MEANRLKVRICVPWRGGDRYREQSWAFVRAKWAEFGFPIVEGDRPGPFSRSAARNIAAKGKWDVAIFVDADTIVRDPAPTLKAIQLAASTGRVITPHDEYCALAAAGTRWVLEGNPRGWTRVERRLPGAPLGVIVVPRKAWDVLGGFDERFDGWGGEDVAFVRAARTLVGLDKLPGQIWHLWHPTDKTKRTYIAGPRELITRYGHALSDPAAMKALLDERAA